MTKDEALKLALEALEWSYGGEPMPSKELEAINAIRQVLKDQKGNEMTDLRQAAEMALEQIELSPTRKSVHEITQALRQALDEWTPDDTAYRPDGLSMPIDRGAWSDVEDATKWVDELRGDEPKREWQWLTEEDIHDLFMSNETVDDFGDFETIACAVSTKLKGKNNG